MTGKDARTPDTFRVCDARSIGIYKAPLPLPPGEGGPLTVQGVKRMKITHRRMRPYINFLFEIVGIKGLGNRKPP